MRFQSLLAGTAALALVACGDAAQDPATQDPIAADQGALIPDTTAGAAMPGTAQEFVTMQAASDMYEVEAGRLAQQQGQSQAVREFGTMMERDHLQSTENLRQAARQVGQATLDPQMTAQQQSDLEALRNAGENFDSVYKRQQVAAHEQALSVLRHFADNGDAPALQDFARQAAPVVEGHLEQARQLP